MKMKKIWIFFVSVFVAGIWLSASPGLALEMGHQHTQSENLPGKFIASKDRSYDDLVGEAMGIMNRDMHSMRVTHDPDTDFVVMMMPHHQGAIDMAKALLLHGKDPELRNLALQIITDQQTEIDQMKAWLKNKKSNLKNKETSK